MTAPIALFTYCRPVHTRRTVDSLLQNKLASESDLIVYSDAARMHEKQAAVDEVRAYLATIAGFRSVTIRHRSENYGLANSIIAGVTEVLMQYESIIVLEDDMMTSPYFLTYMNEALEKYADDDRVVSIHGWVFPVTKSLPEAFFLIGADCWGWATWRRAWNLYVPTITAYPEFCDSGQANRLFHRPARQKQWLDLFDEVYRGEIDTWDYQWLFTHWNHQGLSIAPQVNLVSNLGFGDDATHTTGPSRFANMDTQDLAILIHPSQIVPHTAGDQFTIDHYFTGKLEDHTRFPQL